MTYGAHLLTEPGMQDADPQSLFNGDPFALIGLLCCLSDECHFGWQAP